MKDPEDAEREFDSIKDGDYLCSVYGCLNRSHVKIKGKIYCHKHNPIQPSQISERSAKRSKLNDQI